MTAHGPLADWIRSRSPAPPPQLRARLESHAAGATVPSATADTLVDAGVDAMVAVLRDGCLTRSAALDLLVVDALVTYAFEAAADDPAQLEARTQRVLKRIAALSEQYET